MKKKQDFSTSVSETSENIYLFVFISWLVSFGVSIYMQYLSDVKRNKLQTINIKRVMWTCFRFSPMENIFRKL